MLALLGDSHTRSYRLSRAIAVRIFLGKGKVNNFTSYGCFFSTILRYLISARKLKKMGFELAFVIGEPDIRWLAYRGWDNNLGEDVLSSGEQRTVKDFYLKKISFRLKIFLLISRFFGLCPNLIIGIGTPNPEILSASIRLNERFSGICYDSNCLFFDPLKFVLSDTKQVKEEFVGYSVFDSCSKDWTHLSVKISEHLDQFLGDRCGEGVITELDSGTRLEFLKEFVQIRDFDTFSPVESVWDRCMKLRSGLISRLQYFANRLFS